MDSCVNKSNGSSRRPAISGGPKGIVRQPIVFGLIMEGSSGDAAMISCQDLRGKYCALLTNSVGVIGL